MLDRTFVQEPELRIEGGRPFFFARRGFRRRTVGPLAVLVVATTVMALTGDLPVPGLPVVELWGRAASKRDFFMDPEVQRILMSHRIKVGTENAGSRKISRGDLDPYDFVVLSGKAPGDQVERRREAAGEHSPVRDVPILSSLVTVGTFREYAKALVEKGVATPLRGGAPDGRQANSEPIYYTLHMQKFLELAEAGTTWRSLDVPENVVDEKAQVTAYTSGICDSNSAGTFVAQVAVALKSSTPKTTDNWEDLGRRIQPMLNNGGTSNSDRFPSFKRGELSVPTPVFYEHQFLEYQLQQKAANGGPDTSRVLLYPDNSAVSVPRIAALTPRARRLVDLVTTDARLRDRATELGFRTGDGAKGEDRLTAHLDAHGLPVPWRGIRNPTTDLDEVQLDPLLKGAAVDGCKPGTGTAPPTEGATPSAGTPTTNGQG
ncbi:hypothetical protein ACFCX4_27285 [Kitasatospora sp. NPDC056327]|uniref:hypothetical protein n=1 Tax=Kitasatospora sp. NPDC056327 TaxID=3345785 RepID=UPI0035D6B524